VEADRLGGTCLNRGCIPTKTILRSARIVADTRNGSEFGLDVAAARVDVDQLRERKERVVDELVAQVEGTANRLGVRVVYGHGRLVGPLEIEVATGDGQIESIEGDGVVLATGSVPFLLPTIDHDLPGVWTSDDAVELGSLPPEVLIIGGGVIGLEFACAYAAFGSKVTLVELMEQVLPGSDRRVVRQTQDALEKMGVRFFLGDAVESVEQVGDRVVGVLRSGERIGADVVMSAPGRMPHSAGLGFVEAGIEMDRAAVKVDEHLRTNVRGVYAIGDLIGGMMLAHVAEEEGVIAARNAVAELSSDAETPVLQSVRYDCIPACVYTFPEVAVVGSSRDSAKKAGVDAVQAVAKFSANGKALSEGEAEGFVQMAAEKETGRIIGCQIVGLHAVEIIHEVALAMRHGMGVRELAETVHAHPTVSEVVKLAALDAAAKCGRRVT
jgi:dihydrolipoamide dehydrogenase